MSFIAGHASREPELVRDLYAAAAARLGRGRPDPRTSSTCPALDELIDPWFRLSFGASAVLACARPPESAASVDGRPRPRRRRPDDRRGGRAAGARDDGVDAARRRASPGYRPDRRGGDAPSGRATLGRHRDVHATSSQSATAGSSGIILLYRRPPDLRVPADSIDLAQASTAPAERGKGVGVALTHHVLGMGARAGLPDDDHRLADDEPVRLALLAAPRLPADVPAAAPLDPLVPRMPGSPCSPARGVPVVERRDDAVVLAAARAARGDRATSARRCATRCASRSPARRSRRSSRAAAARRSSSSRRRCRFPARAAGPAAGGDRRRVDELERLGDPERAADDPRRGRARPAGRARELESCSSRRSSRGASAAGSRCTTPRRDLVELGEAGGVPLRVNRALVETDVVVTVRAAETVLDGGAGGAARGGGREALRAAARRSLLETARLAGLGARARARAAARARVPLLGVSLVLDHPRLDGVLRGYPYDRSACSSGSRRSRLRRLFACCPAASARGSLEGLPRELTAVAAFGGAAVGRARRGAAARRSSSRGTRSTSRSTRSGRRSRGRRRTSRASGRTRSRPPHSGSGSRSGSGATRSRSRDGGHGDPAPRLPAALRRPRRSAVPRALPGAARRPRPDGARRGRARGRRRPAGARRPTARAAPATRCCRTSTGRVPTRRSTGSARCSSPAAATRRRPAQLGFVPAHGVGAALTMARGTRSGRARIGFLARAAVLPAPRRRRDGRGEPEQLLAEVGLAHLLVVAQRLGVVGERDAAGLEHVAAVRRVERHQRVLLDEQDGRPLLVDLARRSRRSARRRSARAPSTARRAAAASAAPSARARSRASAARRRRASRPSGCCRSCEPREERRRRARCPRRSPARSLRWNAPISRFSSTRHAREERRPSGDCAMPSFTISCARPLR